MCRVWTTGLLLVVSCLATAAVAPGAEPSAPRVGLVLGGGGARGLAHVGVLEVLEAQGVRPVAVAGTSMGAIIGGLYASGYTPAEIRRIALEIDWEQAFSDQASRRQRSMQRKQDDRLGLIGVSAGFRQGKLQLPTGILSGQRISLILRRLFLHQADRRDFDRLPVPFRAVATDIETGEEVVLTGGDLAVAIQASMNVPGVFAPIPWQGRPLVDGGLVNNLPVTVMRQMDVDYIIAVNVSAPLLERERLDSLLGVTDQLTRMMIAANERYQQDFLTDADVLIVPVLDGVGSADFHRAGEIIDRGRQAARKLKQRLAGLAGGTAARPAAPSFTPVVRELVVDNDLPLNPELVRHALRQQTGAPLDVVRLEQDVEKLYGTGLYHKVDWSLEPIEAGGYRLRVRLRGKPWGPDYLQTGLNLSNDFSGDSAYGISLRYLRTALNPLAGEAWLYARLGQDPLLQAEWFQPLHVRQPWFAGGRGGVRQTNLGLYQRSDLKARYRLTHYGMEAYLGYDISNRDRIQLTWLRERGRVQRTVGLEQLSEDEPLNNAHLRLEWLHDALDSLYFPTRGSLLRVGWMEGRRGLGSDSDYSALQVHGRAAWQRAESLLWLGGEWFDSSSDRGMPLLQRPALGGFLRLSGMQENQLAFNEAYWLANAAWLHDLRPWLGWHSLPSPLYLGVSLELAGSGGRGLTPGEYEQIRASSLFLGMDSWVGPVFFGYGQTDRGEQALFFHLNRPFGGR